MEKSQITLLLSLLVLLLVTGCGNQPTMKTLDAQANGPSKFTNAYNQAYSARLNWGDTTDFANVARGFLAPPVSDVILSPQGDTIYNFNDWNLFVTNDAITEPKKWCRVPCVNPAICIVYGMRIGN